ncbi:MAG: EAL domain-containing protein [Syntrophotaleaceae bacterium]
MKKPRSLRRSLTLLFILAAAFPVLLLGLYFNRQLTASLTQRITADTLSQARALREEITRFLQAPQATLQLVGRLIDDHNLLAEEEIDHYLGITVGNRQVFESILVLSPDGRITHMGLADNAHIARDELLDLDLSGHPFFVRLRQMQRPLWSHTFTSPINTEPTVGFGIPLREGYLIGNIRLAQLTKLIATYQNGNPLMEIVVLDQAGTVIAHSDQQLARQRLNLRNHMIVRDGIEGKEGAVYCQESGENLHGLVILPQTGWMVMVSLPFETALQPVSRVSSLTLAFTFLAIIFATVIALLLAGRLLRPLAAMAAGTRDLSRGRYDIELAGGSYTELAELTDAFKAMAVALQEREQSLAQSHQRYRILFNNCNDAVCVCRLEADDSFGTLSEVNDIACHRLGYDREELLKMNFTALFAPEVRWDLAKQRQSLLINRHLLFESVHLTRNGHMVPVEINARLVELDDGRAILALARDISERKAAEQEIQKLAYYDSLTDLPNRRLLHDRLNQTLARSLRLQKRVAVFFIDLDRFKTINDSLGHTIGDQLLTEVTERFLRVSRREDTLARLGGDEFVLLALVGSSEDASGIAAKLLASLQEPIVLEGQNLFITASVGIALSPDDGTNGNQLLRNADAAMYHAKDQGRNTSRFFSSEIDRQVRDRILLEGQLRGAIDREELELYFQPKVDLTSGSPSGIEALLRWHHAEWGLVSPDRFIPLAEESGLIVPIGEWVLRTACRQLKLWKEAGEPALRLAINLSARQLMESNLVETVDRALAESGIDPRQLELELTESMLLEHSERNLSTFRAFRERGIILSVDDFGTGFSCLSHLKRFPVDFLKIDRSFVSQMTSDPDMAAIAKAITTMAHTLNLKVVAEGVETEEQYHMLLSHGCDEGQGYLFGRPEPAEKILQTLHCLANPCDPLRQRPFFSTNRSTI